MKLGVDNLYDVFAEFGVCVSLASSLPEGCALLEDYVCTDLMTLPRLARTDVALRVPFACSGAARGTYPVFDASIEHQQTSGYEIDYGNNFINANGSLRVR